MDRYGNKTLRDQFPIRCRVCGNIIAPAQYDTEGNLIGDAEKYWVCGMILVRDNDDAPIPCCLYGHRSCLGMSELLTAHPPALHFSGICEYCGKELRGTATACQQCLERIAKERRSPEQNEALAELLRNLTRMRIEAQIPDAVYHQDDQQKIIDASTDKANDSKESASSNKILWVDRAAVDYGEFVPANETGVIFMFGGVVKTLGYRMIHIAAAYPDAVLRSPTNKLLRVEFEYCASNFVTHGHDPALCDMVVCWRVDRRLPLPTIGLSDYYDAKTGEFDFASLENGSVARIAP